MPDPTWHITLARPLWLIALLAPAVLLLVARWNLQRQSLGQRRRALLLRSAMVLLLVLALVGIAIEVPRDTTLIVVARDRSASIGPTAAERADRLIEEIHAAALAAEHPARVVVVDHPEKPSTADRGSAETANPADSTDLAATISAARTIIDAGQPARIVLLSDGNATHGDTLSAAKGAGVPVDTIPLPAPEPEVYVASVDAPASVHLGQPLAIDVGLHHLPANSGDSSARVKLWRGGRSRLVAGEGGQASVLDGGRLIAEREVTLPAGDTRISFTDRVTPAVAASDGQETAARGGPRAVTYWATVEPSADTLPGNNVGGCAVVIRPRPRVLLAESSPLLAQPLREALAEQLVEVDVVSARNIPEEPPTAAGVAPEAENAEPGRTASPPVALPSSLEQFKSYDAVVLSNLPAAALDDATVSALDEYVHDFGGGLIVIGGDRTLTAGQFEGTLLERMLPVESYIKTQKKKPRLAMLLVLDRSGSMAEVSQPAAGDEEQDAANVQSQPTPIALAKEAARRAVERLAAEDQIGILAFEDRSHWAVPLQPVGEDRGRLLDSIEAIQAGGGTNMGPALDRAILALRSAYADLRHVIVLTDGVSHPADFTELAQAAAEQGITVSTVGVGSEVAKPLLREIARITDGHAYFVSDPTQLPSIFVQEATSAGRLGITEEPFRPSQAGEDPLLTGLDAGNMPTLLGYVDTRAKPPARVTLATPAGDPLLAWWRWGQGTAMTFTSDVHSRWGAAWLRWPGFGPFWARLVRFAMRPDDNPYFDLHAAVASSASGSTPGSTGQTDGWSIRLDAVHPDGRWANDLDVRATVLPPPRTPGGTGNANNEESKPVAMPMPLIAPGRYQVDRSDRQLGVYWFDVSALSGGELVNRQRRGLVKAYPEELRIEPANANLLRQIAEQTGGRFSPTIGQLLKPLSPVSTRSIALWPWLLALAALVLVADLISARRQPGLGEGR